MAETIHERAHREAEAGRLDAAIAMVRLHLRMKPRDLEAVNLLGTLLQSAGQLDESLRQFERIIAAEPHRSSFRHNHANALLHAGRPREAVAQWERVVAAEPNYVLGWIALSVAYIEVDDTQRAIDAGRRAVALQPSWPAPVANLGFALARAGEMDEAIRTLEAAVGSNPDEHRLHSSYLMLLNYSDWPAADIAAAHRHFGIVAGMPVHPACTAADPARPLRMGVLSGDLLDHSVAFFVEPLLSGRQEGLVLEAFSVRAPSASDATTARLKPMFDAWHECASMSPQALDAFIRERRIDVLLELGGHTESNRLPALIGKPAPVIVSAIGYPNTTGLPAIDLRLVDSITDPPGSEALCSERLLRLDPCFLCYTPPEGAPEPAGSPPDGPITFGSFNNAAKIGSESIALWARTLRVVPNARLLLKSQTLNDAAGRRRIERQFAEVGIDASRLELIAFSRTREEHLKLYDRVHVALDTTPYNGTTTTCESLWMGVPVVALLGDRHAARVSASLLHAAGHPELVARDHDAFVTLASGLAKDHARLTSMRANLRNDLRASTLLDATAYAQRFHAAIRSSWRSWCAAVR